MNNKTVVVAVSGAFDPPHIGHIRYIREAAKLGDRLVVILNSDDFLLKKKGFVFWPFAERKEMLESISGVDEVVAAIDKDQTVRKTLELVRPDIFAKGGDMHDPADIPETDTCLKIGCMVVTSVGGGTIRSVNAAFAPAGKSFNPSGNLKVTCPYCADHPMLKNKCACCSGTGKIEVNKAVSTAHTSVLPG